MHEPDASLPPLTRRDLIRLAAAATAGATLARPRGAAAAPPAPGLRRRPDEELTDLVEGNKRFMSGQATGPRRRPEDFAALAQGQNPTAVVLSC